ncbi:PREDICTED: LOW QUALITY PROTEIN: probable glutamate receptor [Ceratosolen solmsi marchali]|uniref:LOW QUALITY PROTEIN: probable glutamate receptor n=1 Tax=Ceratosolen solmsi marchali TaxID=326594 RepID=A0AAJ6YGI4_9HYME|nr:PREDICTED: LOW QUALITY PROTEIN: probable glutamate receptor [Ceratosolen solmsi marchali]
MRQQFSKEIAPWISMAYINWIIFFRQETNIHRFFSEIFVPLDCIFLVVRKYKDGASTSLTEIYNIDKDRELLTNLFGVWNEKDGLRITKLTLYQRRNDLYGQMIKVATVQDPPVSLIERNSSGEIIGIKGFFGTVIQILQKNLNCTVTYAECDSWGYVLPNGSWTGIVGMLVRKEIDLAATELLMTSDRLEAIEFTTPVFSTKCRTFIKRPYFTAIKWTAYSDPFYSGHSTALIDAIRIIDLVVHLTGVIILAAYSAALISFLAVKIFIMPFSSMEGLLNDGSYKFGVIRNSADYNFFQNTSDVILQRMFEEILDDVENLPRNYLEGLNNICSQDKYAFMVTDNMFAILEHQVPCILEPLDTIMQTTLAMAVPSRSPFRGIINSNILLMRDSGVLQRVLPLNWSYNHLRLVNLS